MRSLLFFITIALVSNTTKAQLTRADSLAGFNATPFVLDAHQRNFNQADVKAYIKRQEQEFLKKKYKISPYSLPVSAVKIGSGAGIANAPCVNEGFEGLAVGQLLAASGWSAATGNLAFSPACNLGSGTYMANSASALVATTPITDANVGNVATSPFGGTNVLVLNKPSVSLNAKVVQTFAVASTNFIYTYAYKGYSSGAGNHVCCDAPSVVFNFYNCSGTLIPGLSKTVIPSTNAACTPMPGWVMGAGTASTPNWYVDFANLAPYIGSCITVEIIASNCTAGSHQGYLYYDAKCDNSVLMANGDFIATGTYTSCVPSVTLSGLPGYSYLWQGPANSGVTGATGSMVTTSTAGNYTLTTTIGTVVATQTLNVFLNNLTNVSITGSSTVCAASQLSLQATGGGLTSYTWSTGSNNQSITTAPASNTMYVVTATNSLGCISSDTKTIGVSQPAAVAITAPNLSACQGQSVTLSISSPAAVSFTWGTGANTPTIAVSPSVTTLYTATVATAAGCTSTASQLFNVMAVPQITAGNVAICRNQSITLSPVTLGATGFLWNNGNNTPSITVSPILTTSYSLVVSNQAGCVNSASMLVTVYSLPVTQIIAPNLAACLGQSVALIASVTNYTALLWSDGSATPTIGVTPLVNTTYSLTATSANGCTNIATQAISVIPLPQFSITASNTIICIGESTTLTVNGSGLTNYQWSNGTTVASMTASPAANIQYSVMVTGTNGCTAGAVKTVVVSACTGLADHVVFSDHLLQVFPNPGNGSFFVKSDHKESGVIVNELGQIIRYFELNEENQFKQAFSGFASGVYFAKTAGTSVKIIVD